MSPTGENDEAAVRPGQAKVLPLDFELHTVREFSKCVLWSKR